MSGTTTVVELSDEDLAENIAPREADPAPVAEAEAKAPQEPKTPAWMQKRLDVLARQRGEAERRAELEAQRAGKAEALLKKLATAANPEEAQKIFGEDTPAAPTDGDLVQVVNARAAEIADVRAFNEACNTIYHEGVKQFNDFADRLALARSAEILSRPLVEAASELGNAHEVLYNLMGDMDEAERIAQLSPVKMAVALARFAEKKTSVARKISAAPPPITPVSGHASPTKDPEKMSAAEWRKWREQQLAEKNKR